MKDLKIGENCNGCGYCIVSAPDYFGELPDGNAKVIKSSVDESDEKLIETVAYRCPKRSVELVEKETFSGDRSECIQYAINEIKRFNEEFRIEKVTAEEFEFYKEETPIYFPVNEDWSAIYSSKSAAKSAARSVFVDQCYSEQAYRPKLKEIFVNYKVNKLRPYYLDPAQKESAYYDYVQKVNLFLQNIAEVLKANRIGIDEKWKIYAYPVDEYTYYGLEHFDDRSTYSGIIQKLKDRGEFTSADWYIDHNVSITPELIEIKKSLFGGDREIYKYYYSGVYSAADEFGKDLGKAIARKSYEITKDAINEINTQLEKLEEDIHKQLCNKIDELRNHKK